MRDCRCKCKFKDAVCNDVIFVSHSFRSKYNNFSEFLSLFFHTFNEAFFIVVHFSGAPRARSACVGGAPWLSKSTHPRKFANHVTVHRPPTADRPSVRTTGKPMFTLTHLLSYHFSPEKLALLSLVKEVTSSPDRKRIKLLTSNNLFPPF